MSKAFLAGGKVSTRDREFHQEFHCLHSTSELQFYLCGSGKIATEVKKKLIAIIQEARQLDEAAATVAFAEILNGRFATDVFE